MLRYYIDHNFHADIVRGLRRRNIDCLTAAEDGYRRAKDPALLSRATESARVLVTHDDDFLTIVADWLASNRDFAGIVYAHPWSVRIGRFIEDLELVAHCHEPCGDP